MCRCVDGILSGVLILWFWVLGRLQVGLAAIVQPRCAAHLQRLEAAAVLYRVRLNAKNSVDENKNGGDEKLWVDKSIWMPRTISWQPSRKWCKLRTTLATSTATIMAMMVETTTTIAASTIETRWTIIIRIMLIVAKHLSYDSNEIVTLSYNPSRSLHRSTTRIQNGRTTQIDNNEEKRNQT